MTLAGGRLRHPPALLERPAGAVPSVREEEALPKYLNTFARPKHIEETIRDSSGNVVGTIRVKSSSVLWKPESQRKFYTVPLATFTAWITDAAARASWTSS